VDQPTIGLCVIVKEYTHVLEEKLAHIHENGGFTHAYIQVNGAPLPKTALWPVFEFEWVDDFAAARNALMAHVTTDYWYWIDDDDMLENPQNIPKVIRHMRKNDLDIVFADYIYQRNEQGIPTEVQRRERFFKTGTPGAWQGVIHETFIPHGSPATEDTSLVRWIHHKTKAAEAESTKRNERMLRSEYAKTGDPRLAYYLGLNLSVQGKFEPAIKMFRILIDKGGWDEERYRAFLQIASCYQQMKQYREAASEYLNATTELPAWPDAYYGLQQVYYEVDDHEKSIEWFEIARGRTRPNTDSAYNPVVIEYQPLLIAGLSYLFIGQALNAVKVIGELKRLAPNYGELPKIEPEVLRAYNEEQAIAAARTLIKYNKKYGGEPAAVLGALPAVLRADVRLTAERRELIPGIKWPKGSVVFYCGQNYEPWGPDYLEGGMGGSEEAVVYLARELNLLDRQVVVYNERTTNYEDFASSKNQQSPRYHPWTEINPNDEFDVFVAWRDPGFLQHINARVKICDVHDALQASVIYANQEWVDVYMFKSWYHRNLYPDLPDSKCRVVSNGIVREQFK
jgi:tetratricopeptide (TPR) repeat protein